MVKIGYSYYGLLQAFKESNWKLKTNHSHTNQIALGFYKNKLLKSKNLSLQQFVRFNSTDTSLTKKLYIDRLAPVKPFTDKTILSVSNILDLGKRASFFNKLKYIGKGGIYLFQYKNDPLVFT
jgi:hypothetical protein